jgi:hypothetical protein
MGQQLGKSLNLLIVIMLSQNTTIYTMDWRNSSCSNCRKSEIIAMIFLCLLFKDWREKVEKLLNAVVAKSQMPVIHQQGISYWSCNNNRSN